MNTINTPKTNFNKNNIEAMMNIKPIDGFKPYLMTNFETFGNADKICVLQLGNIKLTIEVFVRYGEGCSVNWKIHQDNELIIIDDIFLTADYYDEKDAYLYAKGVFYSHIKLLAEQTINI